MIEKPKDKGKNSTIVPQTDGYIRQEKEWFTVKGDVDDFIFYMPDEKLTSER